MSDIEVKDEVMESWERRLEKQQKLVEQLSDSVLEHPGEVSEDWLRAYAQLVKEVATDSKNFADVKDAAVKAELVDRQISVDEDRIVVDREKTETQAKVDREKIEADKDFNKKRVKADWFKTIVTFFCGIAVPILGVFMDRYKEKKKDERFYVASKFEDENAYLKKSSQKALDDGLREPESSTKKSWWKLF